jgi:hypothetical protein
MVFRSEHVLSDDFLCWESRTAQFVRFAEHSCDIVKKLYSNIFGDEIAPELSSWQRKLLQPLLPKLQPHKARLAPVDLRFPPSL